MFDYVLSSYFHECFNAVNLGQPGLTLSPLKPLMDSIFGSQAGWYMACDFGRVALNGPPLLVGPALEHSVESTTVALNMLGAQIWQAFAKAWGGQATARGFLSLSYPAHRPFVFPYAAPVSHAIESE